MPSIREFRHLAYIPVDQLEIEKRSDVLVFSTPVLTTDIEVSGPVSVRLFASSSAPNTDFTAKLVDVFPDGRAIRLCDGIIRTNYEIEPHTIMDPEKIYQFNIMIGNIANQFKKGHRIRLEISSSNFPRFDRHLNTTELYGKGKTTKIAKQTIYHGKEHASFLLLPVMDQQKRLY